MHALRWLKAEGARLTTDEPQGYEPTGTIQEFLESCAGFFRWSKNRRRSGIEQRLKRAPRAS